MLPAETCILMTWLGYGPEIRQARRDHYKEYGKRSTAVMRGQTTWIITGSKAEGLTCHMENDTDMMLVPNRVICLEDGLTTNTFPIEITVLRSYSRMCYSGHCRLLLERRGTRIFSKINNAFCDDGDGRETLSSDLYVKQWSTVKQSEDVVLHARAGPSLPSTTGEGIHRDIVHAFRYSCPNILSKWATRPRHWPPPEAVQQVVSLGAFLSPVGFKGSEDKDVEWRVCFNAGEIELVNNLNDTQVKLYVLLKMVKKYVLNPRNKEVTSFTMKNIAFWIAENNPQSMFHARSLLYWLHEGLDALRVALISRELPYYMIPDRNLMAASGLEEEQQRSWISTITDMINEGPRMILRLPKIRQAIIAHPEPFRWYNRRKMEMEMLVLKHTNRYFLCVNENGIVDETDVITKRLDRRILELMKEIDLRMIMEGSPVNNLQDVMNRLLM